MNIRTGTLLCGTLAAFITALYPVAAKTTTITYSTWGNSDEVAVEKKLISAFMKVNPGINVKLTVPAGNYEEQLTVLIAAGSMPDVISLDRKRIPDFAAALRPIPLQAVDRNAYLTSSLQTSLQYNGQQLCLPKRMNTKTMFWDKGAFDRSGMSAPTSGWTPAQFGEAAKKLTVAVNGKVDRWGSGPLIIWNWFAAFGAELYNTNVTKALFTSDEMVEATKFMVSLHRKYAGSFADFSNFDRALMTGKVPMYTDIGPWYLPGLMASKDLDWRLTKAPGKPLDPEVVGVALSKTTKHYNEALSFIKFISASPEAQSIIAQGTNLPVTRAGVKTFLEKVPGKSLDAFTDVLDKYTFPQLAKKRVNTSNLDVTIWDTFYLKILSGATDPMTGLNSLQKTIQSRLDAAKK